MSNALRIAALFCICFSVLAQETNVPEPTTLIVDGVVYSNVVFRTVTPTSAARNAAEDAADFVAGWADSGWDQSGKTRWGEMRAGMGWRVGRLTIRLRQFDRCEIHPVA